MHIEGFARSVLATLVATAAVLVACDSKTAPVPARPSTPSLPLPEAFDRAARVISAQGYKLAECVAVADDSQKLGCYATLGFRGQSDTAGIEAMSGAMDVLAGRRWQVIAPSPGNASSFQGTAYLSFAALKNEGPMAFRNTRIRLQCPVTWGGPSNQKWAASVELPFDVAYDAKGKEHGTMTVEVDGKAFHARQFSRSSFNVQPESVLALRDALVNGKSVAIGIATLDGKTGAFKTALPEGGESLMAYFDKFCP